MSYLVLVRHGLSEYNKKGLWTGWTDIDLTEEGYEQAKQAGEQLKDIQFNYAYCSALKRTRETLDAILAVLNQHPPITSNAALNERNYGDYTGKNKWEIKKEVGEETFQKIRRSWDYPIPNGESLKQVYAREIPYFQEEIEPKLKQNNILIVSSGNSLRALVKYLEKTPDEHIGSLEIGTGEVYVYTLDEAENVVSKEIRSANSNARKV